MSPPTGDNINAGCGSTATELLSKTVVETGADVGVALDGDADRLIMCDETGKIIDGDQLLGLMATSWSAQDRLSGGGIVATVMSNLGLERYLEGHDLHLVRTQVGDRHVASRMRADGYNVGGEQSGHLLMTQYSPTGDGTMAAIQILAEIKRQGRPASEVLNVFEPVPQILKNVRYSGESPMTHPKLLKAIETAQADFAGAGARPRPGLRDGTAYPRHGRRGRPGKGQCERRWTGQSHSRHHAGLDQLMLKGSRE